MSYAFRLSLRAAVEGDYLWDVFFRSVVAIAIGMSVLGGCQRVVALPPQVTFAEIEPAGRAARPVDCQMPVLRQEPLADFKKIAIIEGLGNVFGTEQDVLPAVMRKACETGADAIIIVTSKSQTSENMTGYYINAVAINYTKSASPIASEAKPKP
jgi:hypothetical protein